ncbi:sigma-54-dependent transcriptional regulator [Alkaliphilus peptidifermentans]|uniref:Stage 0 sporulation protein A homolog n=1 Tax=Alkaliphilus peptidifermentans DSM 18978 TaxID=1120976 RepID=A0A1G5L4V9_9FIRM|nr:sigma-54 dependent transcriptional regulator [Alkaliphilus peptidifermentans]SCZ07912.1 two-component system, NtrC family, response regulator AtoC [Alkaliphilus peptidifermentans DSM 18978]
MHSILIIDDEINILTSLKFALEDRYTVYTTIDPLVSYEILNTRPIDLVLLDQRLADCDGLEVLQNIKQNYPGVIVIAMTAYGTIQSSVEAIQRGAYYYVTKPLNLPELFILITKALEYQNSAGNMDDLTRQLNSKQDIKFIIGSSKAISRIFEIVERIKDLDINVLITGESGTGKELVAKAIHYWGKRKSGPLQTVNCASIPYNLLESELFGYEKGAFTGASQKYKGKFQLAQGGTLFLDEIGDMDLALQGKLLRAIQERVVTPLGSEKNIPIDVTFIAATNRNLSEDVKKGNFREDLFFRLNVITIEMPPLRNRKEDIPTLVRYFMEKYNKSFNKKVEGITPSAIEVLENYHYPGNIRELQNIIERAVALTDGYTIQVKDFPKELTKNVVTSPKEWFP